MTKIRENLGQLRERIRAICQKNGRDPDSIILVGVTKFADAKQINEALSAGLKDIGENKVQQAQEKFASPELSWGFVRRHMVGHLQTNKVNEALELFDVIQSVDSLKLAKAIQDEAKERGRPIEVLIQVNTSGEEQKFGLKVDETIPLLKGIESFKYLQVAGLMTIAPLTEHKEIIRVSFRDLRHLYEKIKTIYRSHPTIRMKYLSMGMSQDYEIAIEEGANMLRIGTAIFGSQS